MSKDTAPRTPDFPIRSRTAQKKVPDDAGALGCGEKEVEVQQHTAAGWIALAQHTIVVSRPLRDAIGKPSLI